MLFTSIQYLVFLIVVCLLYFILPHRFRWALLLVGSYFFYMCWNVQYSILLFLTTCLTFASGILLNKADRLSDDQRRQRRKRLIVVLTFILNLSVLAFFKYYNFFAKSLEGVTGIFNASVDLPELKLLLPVGISFYMFQALSYTMDVYRGKIPCTYHFGKFALFVSFFPQLLSGPIERAPRILPQLDEEHRFDYEKARDGVILILWGLFKKVVIADRCAILVNAVFNNAGKHNGVEFLIATIFYTIQIYCDFSAYSDVALGSASIMGFNLMRNFNRPYFSKSVAEFWRRWHISLSSWFRDYLYFPLGGSRVKKWRHLLNLMIVFVVSGLWHGANWTFVIWGALHGVYQVIGVATRNLRTKAKRLLGLKEGGVSSKIIAGAITFALVSFAWIFFRANSLADAAYIVKGIFSIHLADIAGVFNGGLAKLGFTDFNWVVSIASISVLVVVETFQRRGEIRPRLKQEFFVLRWSVYLLLMFSIILLGMYGDLNAAQFIYFKF